MPSTAVDVAAGQRGDAGQPAEQVERGALAGQERRARCPRRRRRRGRRLDRARRPPARRSKDTAGSSVRKTASAAVETADDAGLLEQQLGTATAPARRARRSSGRPYRRPPRARRGRPASSLASLRSRPSLEGRLLRRRGGRRGRRTPRPRSGKSTRKWPPRLSARASALSATSRASRWGESSEAARARRRRGRRPRPARGRGGRSGVDCDRSAAGARQRTGRRRRQVGLVERGQRGPAAEDEALEQRVRRQPVRAVDAGAGALAGGVEAGQRRCDRRGR